MVKSATQAQLKKNHGKRNCFPKAMSLSYTKGILLLLQSVHYCSGVSLNNSFLINLLLCSKSSTHYQKKEKKAGFAGHLTSGALNKARKLFSPIKVHCTELQQALKIQKV